MPPLRIAFDMDGTLADFGAAYAAVESGLFGAPCPDSPEQPRPETQRREQVWRTIEETIDFWTTLQPLEPGVILRLHELSCQHNWEVFFITQRPATSGATVQRQTHDWLVAHGFATPSVIPLSSGRGRAAAALHLDYLVDDSPQNCIDVLADSSARSILVVRSDDVLATRSARKLGIGTANTVAEVLDVLVQATEARNNPSLFEKVRKLVGWK